MSDYRKSAPSAPAKGKTVKEHLISASYTPNKPKELKKIAGLEEDGEGRPTKH